MKQFTVGAAVGALIVLGASMQRQTLGQSSQAPSRAQYQYRVLTDDDLAVAAGLKLPQGGLSGEDFFQWQASVRKNETRGLNNLSRRGWELVAIYPGNHWGATRYYFKRPK